MEPCDTSSPTIISTQISTQTRVCFGHGCVTWFDDNHEIQDDAAAEQSANVF